MAITEIRATIRRSIVLVAATAVGVGLSAMPAEAAVGKMRATLENVNLVGKKCRMTVDAVVTTSQAEAQALIDARHRIVMRVWGEDPISDDLLHGPYVVSARFAPGATAYITAAPEGFKFHKETVVSASSLNEDTAFPLEWDEIYAGVRLVDSSGKTIRSAETNREIGPFGPSDYGSGCT